MPKIAEELYQRTGELGAAFETSVTKDLAAVGKASDMDYVMVTGTVDFTIGSSNNQKPADSVVYVAEGNSGRVAAYTLMYNKGSGAGTLVKLFVSPTRAPIRDQGN